MYLATWGKQKQAFSVHGVRISIQLKTVSLILIRLIFTVFFSAIVVFHYFLRVCDNFQAAFNYSKPLTD